jgi:hypothetical protein
MKFEKTRNATFKPTMVLKVNLDESTVIFSKDWFREGEFLAHSLFAGKVYLQYNTEAGVIRKCKTTNLVDKLKVAYPNNNRFGVKQHIEEGVEYFEVIPMGYKEAKLREYTPEQLEELKERGKKLAQSRYSKEEILEQDLTEELV